MTMYCEVCSSKVSCFCPCECTERGVVFLLGAFLCFFVGFYIDDKSDYHMMAQCYYGVALLLLVLEATFIGLICKRRKIYNDRVLIEY